MKQIQQHNLAGGGSKGWLGEPTPRDAALASKLPHARRYVSCLPLGCSLANHYVGTQGDTRAGTKVHRKTADWAYGRCGFGFLACVCILYAHYVCGTS
jgi:hypothetical protein